VLRMGRVRGLRVGQHAARLPTVTAGYMR
jgi:hypothetical protein